MFKSMIHQSSACPKFQFFTWLSYGTCAVHGLSLWPAEGQCTANCRIVSVQNIKLMCEFCRDTGSPGAVCINDMVRKPAELPSSNVTLKSVSISFLISSKSSSNHSLTRQRKTSLSCNIFLFEINIKLSEHPAFDNMPAEILLGIRK